MPPRKKPAKKKRPQIAPLSLGLPLKASSGMPSVRQGEGGEILKSTIPHKTPELPYRAFWTAWELVEAAARKNYERYREGPLSHVAQAHLEAVIAFREAYHGRTVRPVSPERYAKELQRLAEPPSRAKKAAREAKQATVEVKAEVKTDSEVKKKRCRSIFDGYEFTVRCSGPEGHPRKLHKGRVGDEIIEWEDEPS